MFKAYFAKQDYANALKWCDWTIDRHPTSLEAKKCQFKKALIFFAQQDFPAATKQLQSVANDASNPLRPEAEQFIRTLAKLQKTAQQEQSDP